MCETEESYISASESPATPSDVTRLQSETYSFWSGKWERHNEALSADEDRSRILIYHQDQTWHVLTSQELVLPERGRSSAVIKALILIWTLKAWCKSVKFFWRNPFLLQFNIGKFISKEVSKATEFYCPKYRLTERKKWPLLVILKYLTPLYLHTYSFNVISNLWVLILHSLLWLCQFTVN